MSTSTETTPLVPKMKYSTAGLSRVFTAAVNAQGYLEDSGWQLFPTESSRIHRECAIYETTVKMLQQTEKATRISKAEMDELVDKVLPIIVKVLLDISEGKDKREVGCLARLLQCFTSCYQCCCECRCK